MQGSYKNNGLPRPYYMKPNKRGSAYDSASRLLFLTNSRKLLGYLVMLALFGLCMFMVAQELKPRPDVLYEIMDPQEVKEPKNNGDVGNLVVSDKKDKNFEQPQVANNKAQNSRGEYGHGVMEAPKGGMVNEGPVVGADEGLVVDGKTKKKSSGVEVLVANDAAAPGAPVVQGNGVKATREGDKKAADPQNPDLRKLNEKNHNLNNVAIKGADLEGSDAKLGDTNINGVVEDRMHKKVDAKGKIDDDDTKAEKKDVGGEPKKRKTTDDSNVDEESKKNVDDKPKKNIAEGNQDEIVKKLAKDVARPKKEIPFNEDEIDAVVKKGLKQDAVKKDLDDEDDAAQ